MPTTLLSKYTKQQNSFNFLKIYWKSRHIALKIYKKNPSTSSAKQEHWREHNLEYLNDWEDLRSNQPNQILGRHLGTSKGLWAKSEFFIQFFQFAWQCTIRYAMSIDILEVHKSKNSLHAHFMLKSIHSFFIWCKTTKILTLYQNFKKIAHIWGVIVEKLKGGSGKAEILVVFKLQYL